MWSSGGLENFLNYNNIQTRGPFAASLAMIKTLCPTNTILDIIEEVIRRVSI